MSTDAVTSGKYLPRLIIHVVWHPEFARGREVGERVYAHFARDPDSPNTRGLGIPVFYRSALASGERTPPPIDLQEAQHSVVVVLVDAKMTLAQADWGRYVRRLWEEAATHPARHRVFPVACFGNAYHVLPEANFIRLQDQAPERAISFLLNRLTNEMARLLTQRPPLASAEAGESAAASPPKMRLFLSHAKRDGEKTALALRDYIHEHLALDTFFDAIDIAAGFRFSDEIDSGIDTAAFVLVHTDAYATRIWCQHEILRAKRHGRPVVVVHAIEEGEARSFPYLGNVPTIRWRADQPQRIDAVLGLVLREVLRSEYFVRHFADLKSLFDVPPEARALPRAPELLTALALRTEAARVPFFVYPDPPLARQELELVLELAPTLRLTTPTLLFANPQPATDPAGHALMNSLAGCRIGLSISDIEHLALRGLGLPRLAEEKTAPPSAHLRDAMAEFARFFLAAGATLAYGGDLRQGGFTLVLFELLAGYRAMSGEEAAAVQSYLAWPIHLDLTEEQEAGWAGLVDFHRVPPPGNIGVDPRAAAAPTSAENRAAWALSLTAMRERMNVEIDARVLLGGQIGSFGVGGLGRYPGLLEEALLALRAGRPVYHVGAFGGCTEAIIAALQGRKPAAFTAAERQAGESVRATLEVYRQRLPAGAEAIDYDALLGELERIGVAGLNNGLTPEENERLFVTPHLPEMIALVLRGLSRVKRRGCLVIAGLPPPARLVPSA